jgi:hypothetical protein
MIVQLTDGGFYNVTDTMQGKMKGMWSLNTSAEHNPFCMAMRKNPDNICSHCYSKTTERRWKNCEKAWTNNMEVLSKRLLTAKEIPILNLKCFRFSAHGDLVNRTHYKNLIQIVEANPQTIFTIWTKNMAVINKGGVLVRDNFIHIHSTPHMNVLVPTKPKGFDKVFSVYTRPFVKEHGVKINCGAKN